MSAKCWTFLTELVGVVITLYTCIWEVLCLNLVHDTGYSDRLFVLLLRPSKQIPGCTTMNKTLIIPKSS